MPPTLADQERPQLHSGDRMSREEFHRIYSRMPEGFRAELVGGVVYVASPLKRSHGTHHALLGTVFGVYSARTTGVESGDNATIKLGDEGEPQPDLYLRILELFGGQSWTTEDDYVAGAPELLAEIALSSRSIDLHAKYDDYRTYGVKEYLVACLTTRTLHAFDLQADSEYSLEADGIYRSRMFPGLWIDGNALFAGDGARLLDTVGRGLESPEHAAFVQELQRRRTS